MSRGSHQRQSQKRKSEIDELKTGHTTRGTESLPIRSGALVRRRVDPVVPDAVFGGIIEVWVTVTIERTENFLLTLKSYIETNFDFIYF